MSDPQLPPRPEPPRRLGDAVQRWLAWFGVGRLVVAAVSVAIVVAGLFWLVRTEPPPVEASLPMASAPPPTASSVPPDPPRSSVPEGSVPVVVHVAGSVRSPGVYRLAADARVDDAVHAAGGPLVDADLDGLNLAALLVDGQRVYVPRAGEVDPASISSGVPPSETGDAAPAGPVDLNVATVAELESLPGIGPATAAAIIEDRERNGPFATVDDLDRVPGIGPAKLAALRDLVAV